MKREDAWRPGTLIQEQPMCHSPVLPLHLIPTSLPPQPCPPCPAGVCICQPSKFTHLTLVNPHTRSLSTRSVVMTHRGGAAPATSNPTHQPNPAPLPDLAPANEYPVQQQQGTGTIKDLTLKTGRVYGYHPGFPLSCHHSLNWPCLARGASAAHTIHAQLHLCKIYTPQPTTCLYAWHGGLAIGNMHTLLGCKCQY